MLINKQNKKVVVRKKFNKWTRELHSEAKSIDKHQEILNEPIETYTGELKALQVQQKQLSEATDKDIVIHLTNKVVGIDGNLNSIAEDVKAKLFDETCRRSRNCEELLVLLPLFEDEILKPLAARHIRRIEFYWDIIAQADSNIQKRLSEKELKLILAGNSTSLLSELYKEMLENAEKLEPLLEKDKKIQTEHVHKMLCSQINDSVVAPGFIQNNASM